jgi:ATP-dependent Lon protease
MIFSQKFCFDLDNNVNISYQQMKTIQGELGGVSQEEEMDEMLKKSNQKMG